MGSSKLRTLRNRAGLNQEDVGNEVGVVGSTISRWEKGISPIPPSAVEHLARALGVDESEIQEIREAGDDESNGRFVCSKMDALRWLKQVARSDETAPTRAIMLGLVLHLDESSWVVAVSKAQLANSTNLRPEFIERQWPDVLASLFVERVNPNVEYVLRLHFSELF